jgi:DNA-binding XRE family transcriptional regulator
MLVVERTRHIEVELTGRGAGIIADLIREKLPEAEISPDADESIIWKDTATSREIKAQKTPGTLLRAYRERAGLTVVELARAVGTRHPNICAMESGRRVIGLVMARKLGKVLNVAYGKFIE